jgi:hypothetical protein
MSFDMWKRSLTQAAANRSQQATAPRLETQTGPRAVPSTKNPAKLFIKRADPQLAKSMASLRETVVESRQAPTRAQCVKVLRSLDSLPLLERARRMDEAVKLRKLSSKRVSAMEQYTKFTLDNGYHTPPTITGPLVRTFLTWCVMDKGNMSHALEDTLSNLRNAAKAVSMWDVPPAEDDKIKDHIAFLQYTVPSAPKERAQVGWQALVRTCKRLREEDTLESKQKRAAIAMGIAIHARGTEMGGPKGMRWMDILVDHRGLGFDAVLSKTADRSREKRARAFPHLTPELQELCPARAFKEYRAALLDHGIALPPTGPVWTALTGPRMGRPLEVKEVTAMIRGELTKEGVDPKALDSHWQRYMGTELLTHHLRMHPEEADALGDFAPSGGQGGGRSLKNRTYLRPSTKTRDQLMTIAANRMDWNGLDTCCPQHQWAGTLVRRLDPEMGE